MALQLRNGGAFANACAGACGFAAGVGMSEEWLHWRAGGRMVACVRPCEVEVGCVPCVSVDDVCRQGPLDAEKQTLDALGRHPPKLIFKGQVASGSADLISEGGRSGSSLNVAVISQQRFSNMACKVGS